MIEVAIVNVQVLRINGFSRQKMPQLSYVKSDRRAKKREKGLILYKKTDAK